MKDNKNMVFALQSYNKSEDGEYTKNGYLLFPDEVKADNFMQLIENANRLEKKCHYTKHEYVEVNDFIGGRVEQQNNFYVSDLKNYRREDDSPKKSTKSVLDDTFDEVEEQ